MTTQTMDQSRKTEDQILEESRAHHRDGRIDDALEVLRDGLRRGWLGPEGIEKAGRRIAKLLVERGDKQLDVLLLGQCTGTWLTACLTAAGWAGGAALRVREGQYDNVMQELHAARTAEKKPDIVILLPWNQRLLSAEAGTSDETIEETVSFWKQAWQIVREDLGARLIQIGLDWTSPGALGVHLSGKEGAVDLIRRADMALRQQLPAGSFFVDLQQISGQLGRERFYDPRRYYWTKQPFSDEGTARLAHSVFAGIRALTTGPKKVLVLDLDNTLWGGVVGETGCHGIEIGDSPAGEAFRSFQKYAKSLARRGVVLAVCSKNNPDDAREPFKKNGDMQLTLEDFGAFEACWDPKSVAIERIGITLALGIDSFVFFDDNPAEREHVRQALPEVEVVEVPEDPAEYIRALEAGQWFESVALTAEDRKRSEQYRVEAQRREIKTTFANVEEYLVSMKMLGDVRSIDDEDFPRVMQLIGKTNQFNLTTRRHSAETVRQMLSQRDSVGITIRMSDRFGDYGLVALIIGVNDGGGTLRIDTWLMSCRVIGRTAEEFCLNALIDRAKALGYKRLLGHFIPTRKNALVKDLYPRMGFRHIGPGDGGAVSYELDTVNGTPARTFVAAVSQSA
ncbi:MAG TPA: HAD-IIIC family phosphatase [Tepidisphaeraceae bacterium]|nr:HAD-IIIC family phosphatase [Tepidisphaeraceae bacterium]